MTQGRAAALSLVVLAVADNRRCSYVLEAAALLGLRAPRAVGWRDFLRDPAALDRALEEALADSPDGRVVLRVDSPGEDWDAERALIAWGADEDDPLAPDAERVDRATALSLPFERGRVRLSRQWYRGFARALQAVQQRVDRLQRVQLSSATDEIAVLFDKRATHARLAASAVPTTPLLGVPANTDALRSLMSERDERRVFVKPWHGSSASGVVALRWERDSVAATTSAELVFSDGQWLLFNSLRVRRYTDERDVRRVLDALLREGAVVERWLPKATYDGDNFDLRVVTIAGRARHWVVRVGRSPMTNLHLGNRRGDPARVRARLGDEGWRRVTGACDSVARAFAGCNAVGVDVMLSPNLQQVAVIEANAFGDLLPNVEDGGDDTYTAELRSLV